MSKKLPANLSSWWSYNKNSTVYYSVILPNFETIFALLYRYILLWIKIYGNSAVGWAVMVSIKLLFLFSYGVLLPKLFFSRLVISVKRFLQLLTGKNLTFDLHSLAFTTTSVAPNSPKSSTHPGSNPVNLDREHYNHADNDDVNCELTELEACVFC